MSTPAPTLDATQIPPGWHMDSQGRLVHESAIKEVDLFMDQTTRALVVLVERTAHSLATLKASLLDDLQAFAEIVGERYQVQLDGANGTLSLTTYDGLLKITRETGDRITVGPEILPAEELVRQIVDEIDDPVSRAIADRAFRRNRKTGELSHSRLIDLMGLEIDDDRWSRAVKAMRESLRVAGTTVYFRAYRRDRPDEKWQQIPLDFSAIQPAQPATEQPEQTEQDQ